MSIMSITAGGGSWILQLLQTASQMIMAVCSLFYLHREKVFAIRKVKSLQEQKQHTQAIVKEEARIKKTSQRFETTGNSRNETLCIIKRTRLFGNA